MVRSQGLMNKQQLERYKRWFREYTQGHYGADEFVNANLRLKDEHTGRVCQEMRYLTGSLGLGEADSALAEVIALFHDVGRYEQFTRYRTFSDAKSVPHGALAVGVLRVHNVLDGIAERERMIIEEAIRMHAMKELEGGLDEDVLFYTRLIRDADKLDIYRLVAGDVDVPEGTQDKVMVNWFKQGDGYSREIVQAVLDKKNVDYRMLQSHYDMKIMQLAWVYDLNFGATFAKLHERRYIEKIVAMLPETEDISRAARQVLEYIGVRIQDSGIGNQE